MPKYFILYKRRKNFHCTLRLHAFITASQSWARGTDCRDNLTTPFELDPKGRSFFMF